MEVHMKKTILVILIAVMIATPCLADVETEGPFSVDRTYWEMCAMEYTNATQPPSYRIDESWVGFYQGKIYTYFLINLLNGDVFFQTSDRSYFDLLLMSIAVFSNNEGVYNDNSFLAIIQPATGFGVFKLLNVRCGVGMGGFSCNRTYQIGIMHKISDNWTPPEVE
jgi:hypothetical protein